MSTQQTLSLYAAVADITDQMLAAAKQHDWEKLAVLEAECAARIKRADEDKCDEPLREPEQKIKFSHLKRILDSDREIRNIIDPWMVRLSDILTNNAANRQMFDTYKQLIRPGR
ncbi:flagellar protein FliT [Methylobacillus flagellatus]|jgi:flagellar protein FliT|uniref:flagellar protein FliT n=1 Tax=Methylobacillus flagellatus TaxID=405 RepID=UPI0028538820|nr:flagellar protein FliT [Methylobacillus flagellatus]MDR5172601.1 flagellar protein FliT [Methylobacillus flagellatus]